MKKSSNQWWLYLVIAFAVLTIIWTGHTEQQPSLKNSIPVSTKMNGAWEEKVIEIANKNLSPSEKFDELERYMLEYEPTIAEVEKFTTDIINDYQSGSYLSELSNHNRMLTNIFKAYLVEKNSQGAIKDFAFDYFQNVKYTYRGVDTPHSEVVKINERKMEKALEKIK